MNRAAVSLTGLEAAVDPRELDRGFNPMRSSGVLTALLAMFIILFAASAPAQQVMTLVSNLGQTPETPTEFTDVGFHVAQAFTTGSARWGHTVTSVDIGYGDPEGDSFRASIWTVDASNDPDEHLYWLTGPSTFSGSAITFTAPTNAAPLEADTTYAVVATVDWPAARITTTLSDSEGTGSSAGWSIHNEFREGIDVESFISWDEPDSSQTGESLLIAVKGKPRGVTATLEAGKSRSTGLFS